MGARQYVELFHLLFLDQLGRKTDKQSWTLKGGCNLRFFFRSLRYSEDMDLDVGELPSHLLAEKVNGILRSRPFRDILAVRSVEIEHVTEAKQTETTQRWKLGLHTPAASLPLPTKIEFSRRGQKGGVVFGPVAAELIREYELSPILASHYCAATACSQKIHALLYRSVIQARDLFDLHILLSYVDVSDGLNLPAGMSISDVEEKALSIDFEVFKSQVLSYLSADAQSRFDDRETWEAIVLDTVEKLGGLLK